MWLPYGFAEIKKRHFFSEYIIGLPYEQERKRLLCVGFMPPPASDKK